MLAVMGMTGMYIVPGVTSHAAQQTEKEDATEPSQEYTETSQLPTVQEKLFPYEHTVKTAVGSNNAGRQSYSEWASPVTSYLQPLENGTLQRVEAVSGQAIIEQYNQDFQLQNQKKIDFELPLFGGYFYGNEFQFLVFGQRNSEETNEQEILRVVKYDKNWNRLDSTSVYGANTLKPFDAGSLRMAEHNGTLFIFTCHTMYKSSDGRNHQANMTYAINETTMKTEQSFYSIANIRYGYVSHSFNQFIIADGDDLYRVDHGDAYPRAISISKCKQSNITNCNYTSAWDIMGNIGANYTGVSIGSFKKVGNSLLIAGNSTNQESVETWSSSRQRNIFLTNTDTDLKNTTSVWLTNYTEEDKIAVSTPYLVQASDNLLYAMWEEKKDRLITTKIVGITPNGEKVTEPVSVYGRLSDCEPIYTTDGNLVWYASENKDSQSIHFYKLDTKDLKSYERTLPISLSDVRFAFDQKEYIYNPAHRQTPKVAGSYAGGRLTEGVDFTYESYENNLSPGTGTVTLQGRGIFTGTIKLNFTISPIDIAKYKMVLAETKVTYDGTYHWIQATFYDGEKKVYPVGFYKENKRAFLDAGTYEIVYTGNEEYGYNGKLTTTFTIEPKDISGLYIKVAHRTYYANGTEQKPSITVYDSSIILKEGKDYTVTYENNTSVGQGMIHIKGMGNYTGEATQTFTIQATPTPKPTKHPATPKPTKRPTATPTTTTPGVTNNPQTEGKNRVYDTASKAWYQTTKDSGNSYKATYIKPASKTVTSIKIPASIKINGNSYAVTSIGQNACSGYQRLTKVSLGSNITKIGKNAFYNCSNLKSIVISKKVTNIGANAFCKCSKLKSITIKTSKLTSNKVGKNSFSSISKKATIQVPKAKIKTYKTLLEKRGVAKTVKFMEL